MESSKTDIWVATEKIHGANFCFSYNGKEMKYSRRKAFLGKDEKFYTFQEIAIKNDDKIKSLFKNLKQEESELVSIKVYGEIYGGIYPNHVGTQAAV
jgi:enoyl-[acyl-carrier-protein] reductase (NADH)